jgi:hypothetical protein
VGTPPETEKLERERKRGSRLLLKVQRVCRKGAVSMPEEEEEEEEERGPGELHDLLKGNSIMHCLLKGNSIMTEEEERDPGELLHNILPIFLSTNAFSDTKQFLLNTRNPNSNKNLSQESKPTHTGYRYPSRPVSE